jgi:uncharacterized membrane protein
MKSLHVAAGLLALVSGAVALYAVKGGRLHRRSGTLFVYSMLFMAASGALMAVVRMQPINIMAGVLTFYLVLTAMLTVRRPASRWVDIGAALVAVVGGLGAFGLGFVVANSPTGKMDGMNAGPAFVFGMMALLAAVGDVRMLRSGLPGTRRLRRHIWRMCTGMFIAAGSFFLGQAQVFPKAVRSSGLLAVPVLAVLLIMFYWLVRVRFARWRPGMTNGAPRHAMSPISIG